MDRPVLEHLLYAIFCMAGALVGAQVIWSIADWLNRPPDAP
jgi:hypothetical protein